MSNALFGKEFKIKGRHVLAIDVKFSVAGGKRFVPIDLSASIAADQEIRDASQAFIPKYPTYFRIDVKPSYRYNMKKLPWSGASIFKT